MPKRSLLFPLHGFVDWNGGLDLARILSTAILHPDVIGSLDVQFAFPRLPFAQRAMASGLRQWRIWRSGGRSGTDAGSPLALRNSARELAKGYPLVDATDGHGILSAAARMRADIVFPTMIPLGRDTIPRVGYLFDFQHKHLPHLFSERTRRNRDARFLRLANDVDALIVNSKAVAKDVVEYLDVAPDRILTIPYTPHALPWWFEVDPEDAGARHGVCSPFLLICNHFWKHKDHATALRAFAAVRTNAHHDNLQLVMTGDPVDHRDPTHYSQLLALSERLGIARDVHFLGLIPKSDQLALMRGAQIVLQPTWFEGGPGGGAVYEAIGLGVPAVVSDIAVNLEIDSGNVRFFRAGDSDDLAAVTLQALADNSPRPDRASLLERGDANLARLGHAILHHLANVERR